MSKKKKKPNKPSKNLKVLKTYDLLRVDWKDHWSGNSQWNFVEDIVTSPVICVSTGILVHEDKDSLTLAQSIGTNQKISDTITLIKGCIVDRIKLGEIKFAENV